MYSRELLEEAYDSLGKIYLNCIPHKNEHITYEKDIYLVEEIFYKLSGQSHESEINLYCLYVGKINSTKELMRK
jgi:hypothetical protein